MTGKERAAREALKEIKNHMIVGLGTGSTVNYFIKALAVKIKVEKLQITAVTTSEASRILAEREGIIVTDFSLIDEVDLTIDGADEVTNNLDAIKGGGGSLLYEKLVALASKEVIFIVHEEKLVHYLGKFPLALEVVPFYKEKLFKVFEEKGYGPSYRMKDHNLFITDGGHNIIDLHLNEISFPQKLHDELKGMSGVIETGLFLNIARKVIIANEEGVRVLKR